MLLESAINGDNIRRNENFFDNFANYRRLQEQNVLKCQTAIIGEIVKKRLGSVDRLGYVRLG